ncbi:carbohydrate-binding module family 18 protein [Lentithecium fluviatile CBS 122367]|uniref:Carbohydrate-binding module family 18 protein n=1 Tax=Lentithecium fluviatile CBS 122367 TaxID=1168545 RepID=A0A6G1IIB8_9PLEO|nr:carbohydrate-binding module family 18 protein [Lentithecium fluviatile CBS 122367]
MMWSALSFASVGIGASASVIVPHVLPRGGPDSAYSFTLAAYGKASGPIGQLYDGQNRIGGGLPLGHYTIKYGPKGGVIVDKNGRGCILTPPTTQWQCDEGVGGTPGFDISCDKKLLFNGSPEFWACPVDDHGVWNLYTKPNFGQPKCITVTIGVHGESIPAPPCKQSVPPPPPPHKQDCYDHHEDCKPAPPPPPPSPPPPCKDDCKPAPSPPPPPAPKPYHKSKPSPDGTCGGTSGFHCNGFFKGSCCSSFGWCGASPAHCGKGCQGDFGTCEHKPAPPPPPPCEDGKDDKCKPAPPPPPPCGNGKNDKCKPAPPPPKPCGDDKDDDCKPAKEHHVCPTDINGPYEFPHLIIPVDKKRPDKAFSNKLNGTFSDHMCSVFNFDIHPRFAGKKCMPVFLFPSQEKLVTSAYTFRAWGDYGVEVFELHEPATMETTWNSLGPKELLGEGIIKPNLAVGTWASECAAGKKKSIMICGKNMYLDYFQDFNPSPIGLYLRVC